MKNRTIPLFAALVAGALMLPAASTAVAGSQTLAQAEQSNHPDRHGPPGKRKTHSHPAAEKGPEASNPAAVDHGSDDAKRTKPRRPKGAAGKTPQRR